ncbi:hypothetical protein [Brevundimonas sp. NIBR11]|uniref:hypothetical protein n=1 Tax=Brevundimonas sp. NIBR11 TaxID=3015999 RepID=UPI0022EFF434|nr:hypothetical protein [Brevundimonas sp. NIBR11]WGM31292.1 hypothetical protein KKHFBJBL_01536 [Brevundimonas sp. NIBR11]
MSAFEFFFSFYGLLLGLSVAELVGGFSRVLHERQRVRFGWRTPLLALFVAMDVATFWSQAWTIFRGAPFNLALLFIGLVVAATFYVAASVTFPRVTAEGVDERIDLNDHFWAHRRLIFSCILAANVIIGVIFVALMSVDAGFASLSSARLWIGFAVFGLGSAAAAFAPRGIAGCALIALVLYSLFNVVRSALVLIEAGGWSLPPMGS